MIKASQISKGIFLLLKGEPHLVIEREFVNPGKGPAFVRVKAKNVKSGFVIKETIKSQDSVEDVFVETKEAQYLYTDSDSYHFMDNQSYEQYAISFSGLEDRKNYLKEGESYQLVFYEEKPIDIKLPYKMVLTVTRAENAVKGDTVSNITKNVTVETGLEVKVPIFIKEGDRLLVNTETGEYVERVNT
jgi:elongation factor P